jgi:hypothetical protein
MTGAIVSLGAMRNGEGGLLAHLIPAGERRFEVGDCQGVFGETGQLQRSLLDLCDGWSVDVTNSLGWADS